MSDGGPQVAVALLYESAAAAAHLRDGLDTAGVPIAYQAATADFDRIALEESRAQVVLVNLDPSSDGDLDPIHALLDDPRYNVIFNESQSSAQLEGWDQARWLRHLVAKIRGGSDADPPRPEGAEPIPSQVPGLEQAAAMQVQSPDDRDDVPAPAAPLAADNAGGEAVRDTSAAMDDGSAAPAGAAVDLGSTHKSAADAEFDLEPGGEAPGAADSAVDAVAEAGDFDFDTLFDGQTAGAAADTPGDGADSAAVPGDAPAPDEVPAAMAPDFDFDSLFDGQDAGAAAAAPDDGAGSLPERGETAGISIDWPGETDTAVANVAQGLQPEADIISAGVGGADDGLDLDFDGDAFAGAADAVATGDYVALEDAAAAQLPDRAADLQDSLLEAAGHGVDGHAGEDGAAATDDGFDLDLDDLDHLFNDAAQDAGPSVAGAADADAGAQAPAAADDVMLGLDDDVLAALEGENVKPVQITARSGIGLELAPLDDAPDDVASPADFGIETISAASFLAPDSGAEDPAAEQVGQTFDFDLVPMEEAIAPRPVEETVSEFRLSPVAGPAATDSRRISRVWVLVADIGGPEAISDFLALLPSDLDALVVVAQDIGSDLIDVVQRQLAAATSLPVRMALHGERLDHGEVVLVSPEQSFVLGTDGRVALSARQSGTTMINTVLHMVADEFGDAVTAVVFSGMTNDAADGLRYLHGRGGKVHAQGAQTCVASTLPDGARATGLVDLVGSPQELAQQLLAAAR